MNKSPPWWGSTKAAFLAALICCASAAALALLTRGRDLYYDDPRTLARGLLVAFTSIFALILLFPLLRRGAARLASRFGLLDRKR